jgi:Sec7-like guanine-nucleotide exchange factor
LTGVWLARTQIKKKMTCDEFIRNNRGINGPKDAPKDLPRDFLVELYHHFSERAIRFPQLPASMSDKYSGASDNTIMKCAPLFTHLEVILVKKRMLLLSLQR